MSKQRWHPDTCACVIEEDVTGGVVSFSKVLAKCADHASVADNALYGVIHENAGSEQKRKNKILGFLINAGISGLTDIDADSGSVVIKKGIAFNWSWSGTGDSRVLTVWLTGFTLTTQQKNTAQTWCNNQFGSGKVTVA